jgi:hypothetical protein
MEKNETNICWKFGLVNSTIQKTWKHTTKTVSTNEQNGLRIKILRKPKRSGVVNALLECFKQPSSDNVSMSDALVMITFPLSKYQSSCNALLA